MADLKPQRYKDPRPAESVQYVHEWVRAQPPGWTYELVRLFITPLTLFVYRGRGINTENVPSDGPFILAPNHFSNLDHFLIAAFMRRKVQFMAKSQLFGPNPIFDYIFRVGGVFPVRRGHNDQEAFITAHAILGRGGCVCMYCEGGRSRTGLLGEARPGVGRLTLESDAPVVPVAVHGSSSVRRWNRLRFPKVTIQFGEPLSFPVVERPTLEQQLEAAQTIFDRVKEMYGPLEERGRRQVLKALPGLPSSTG